MDIENDELKKVMKALVVYIEAKREGDENKAKRLEDEIARLRPNVRITYENGEAIYGVKDSRGVWVDQVRYSPTVLRWMGA